MQKISEGKDKQKPYVTNVNNYPSKEEDFLPSKNREVKTFYTKKNSKVFYATISQEYKEHLEKTSEYSRPNSRVSRIIGPLWRTDEGQPIWAFKISPNNAISICCGSLKGDGTPCLGNLLYPNGRCRRHGGVSSSPNYKGPNHHSFRTGQYSDLFKEKFGIDDLKKKLNEEELANSDIENALADQRLLAATKMLQDEETTFRVWNRLKDYVDEMNVLMSETGVYPQEVGRELNRVLRKISKLVEIGHSEKEAWREVERAIDHRTKTAMTTAKIKSVRADNHSAQEVLDRFLLLINTAKKYIPDMALRKGFLSEAKALRGVSQQKAAIFDTNPKDKEEIIDAEFVDEQDFETVLSNSISEMNKP